MKKEPEPITEGVDQGILMGMEKRGEIPAGTVEELYGVDDSE